jgi:maltose/moltooligosaccharide transporter
MHDGIFGIQFGLGLEQANMSPIAQHQAADGSQLPLKGLADPMTDLLVQSIIGAKRDRTLSRWSQPTPHSLISACVCSMGLLGLHDGSSL